MRRAIVLHPLLAAVAPLLFLCAHNTDCMDLTGAGPVMALLLISAAAFLGLSSLALRSAARGACLATLVIGLFFTYGHAFEQVWQLGLFPRLRYAHLTVCLAWLALGVAGAWRLARTREIDRWSSLLSLVLVMLAGSSLVKIGYFQLRGREQSAIAATGEPITTATPARPHAPLAAVDSAARPDIYYIILDGYGRQDVLRDQYGFDNRPFLNQLQGRGFYVAERSCANYSMTHLSLSASMNMRFLDEKVILTGDEVPFYEMIRRNKVGEILRSLGYRYVHFATTWSGTEFSHLADITYNNDGLIPAGALTAALKRTSALRILDYVCQSNEAQGHLATLENLRKVPGQAGPTFAFAHLICPHPPFVFDRLGRVRNDISQDQRQSYLDQLQYLNEQMLQVVEHILAKSSTPPIIIVQADHGPAFFSFTADNQDENDREFVTERVPILNAYLVPPPMRERLYPGITPVNTFRLLLSECFDLPHDLLPDRKFVTWYTRPPQIDEVTDLYRDGVPDERLAFPVHERILRR